MKRYLSLWLAPVFVMSAFSVHAEDLDAKIQGAVELHHQADKAAGKVGGSVTKVRSLSRSAGGPKLVSAGGKSNAVGSATHAAVSRPSHPAKPHPHIDKLPRKHQAH